MKSVFKLLVALSWAVCFPWDICAYLYLVFYKLLCVVNLLWGPPDGEQFEVWVTVWRWLMWYLHKCTRLLVDGLDVLPTSANHQPTFMSRDREGHLSSGRTPAPLASTSTSPTRWHPCARRTWGALEWEYNIHHVWWFLSRWHSAYSDKIKCLPPLPVAKCALTPCPPSSRARMLCSRSLMMETACSHLSGGPITWAIFSGPTPSSVRDIQITG